MPRTLHPGPAVNCQAKTNKKKLRDINNSVDYFRMSKDQFDTRAIVKGVCKWIEHCLEHLKEKKTHLITNLLKCRFFDPR